MFDPFSIDAPYSELQFIENLSAYDSNVGTREMLELIKTIQQSGNYYFQGLPFPQRDLVVPGFGTVNGTIQVPQGTYVTSITHYEDTGGFGFKFKVYDKGSKASIFYGDYSLARIVSSNMQQQIGVGVNPNEPFGPNYLMSPFIINEPGVLGWEVVNLSPDPATIQVMLACAVPINKQSIGQYVIGRGY